jgi:hypothetical protein
VNECIRVLVDVCRRYGYIGHADLKGTEEHWNLLAGACNGDWMKLVKYKLTAFFVYHAPGETTMPIPPFPDDLDHAHQLLGGRLGRFIRSMMKHGSLDLKLSFLQSILQSKKGMPRASQKMLRAKEIETVEKLTAIPVKDPRTDLLVKEWGLVEFYEKKGLSIELNQDRMKEQLTRRVKELFGGKKITSEDRVRAFFPSTSANYINNRKNAGAIGSILDHPTLLKDLRIPGGTLHTYTSRDQRGEEERIEDEEEMVVRQDLRHFNQNFTQLWLRILSEAAVEEPHAEPVALAESLKIRVITKGPPFQQTVLRNLWKFTHSVLKRHKTFTLIGTPVTEEIILNGMGGQIRDDELFLSGDYEGATDNLKSWVSETIANAIADEIGLYEVERRLFIQSLTGHTLRGRKQTTGQLMGSITSFPVLCIANATMSAWAYEISNKKIALLKDIPMLINGDDIAMRCTREGYRLWTKITQFGGLKESIGKTFMSREFVNINSTNFIYTPLNPRTFSVQRERVVNVGRWSGTVKTNEFAIRKQPFILNSYINMGLMKGLKRSQGGVSLNDQTSITDNIGARYREMIRLCPSHLRKSAHKGFIGEHKKLLSSIRLPWYVPEWLGGLGLTGVYEPSELDRKIAQMILYNWQKSSPKQLDHTITNWKTWELASKRVPTPYIVEEKNFGTDAYNQAVANECIDLLFDSEISLEKLFQNNEKGSDSSSILMLRYNERLWNPKRYPKLPPPITLEKMIFRGRYKSFLNAPSFINLNSSHSALIDHATSLTLD